MILNFYFSNIHALTPPGIFLYMQILLLAVHPLRRNSFAMQSRARPPLLRASFLLLHLSPLLKRPPRWTHPKGRTKLHFPKILRLQRGDNVDQTKLEPTSFSSCKRIPKKFKVVNILVKPLLLYLTLCNPYYLTITSNFSVQGMHIVKEHVVVFENKLDVMKATEKTIKEKIAAGAKTVVSQRKKIEKLMEYCKKKKDEVLDAAGYYTFKMKSELMKDFLAKSSSHWTPKEDILN